MDLGDMALLAGTGALVGWSVFLAVRVPAVWRGQREVDWSPNVAGPDVHSRGYLPFVLWMNLFSGGCLAALASSVLNVRWLVALGAVALVLAMVAFVLHLMVNMVNRPRWLVPPRLRHQPGWLGQWQRRRRQHADRRGASPRMRGDPE
jgi:hypothetical protein